MTPSILGRLQVSPVVLVFAVLGCGTEGHDHGALSDGGTRKDAAASGGRTASMGGSGGALASGGGLASGGVSTAGVSSGTGGSGRGGFGAGGSGMRDASVGDSGAAGSGSGTGGSSSACSGSADSGADKGDGGLTPASCEGLAHTCGACENEDCCTSLPVPGGSYLRSYDGDVYVEKTWPATVSDFRLDRFEVTVGRFRPFVAATVAGWRPPVGSGKHVHLNGGAGITSNVPESGWIKDYETWVPRSLPEWESANHLLCDAELQSWTSAPSANENRAVNCVNWAEAYAFCIWDGGFLPTEAEWNYAAAGGDEQREYPWGGANPTPDRAVYYCRSGGTPGCSWPVGSRSAGDGRWGQADLAGNRWEWVLDATDDVHIDWGECAAGKPCTDYGIADCVDCAELRYVYSRGSRGGSNTDAEKNLRAALRNSNNAYAPVNDTGFRCARTP